MEYYVHVSDQECKDIMEFDVFGHKDITIISKQTGKEETISVYNLLSSEDQELLIEYAPKLFNTYPDVQKLADIMTTFVLLVSNYRKEEDHNRLMLMMYEDTPVPLKNKSEKDKIKAFKNHCDMLHGLLGTGMIRTKKGDELQRLLIDAYYHPEEYIPEKPKKVTDSYSKIRAFLVSLKLPGKTDIISEFMNSLK